MSGADGLWGVPNDDPGTKDFGPALSEAEIDTWEKQHGVTLPPILRQAYLQQNGGMIRSQRCFFYRLAEVEPTGEEYFSNIGAEPPGGFSPERIFELGYDDYVGCTVFLAYRQPGDPEPLLIGYYGDGGSIAWTADPPEIMRQAPVW